MDVERSHEWFIGHFFHPLYASATEFGPFGTDTGADAFSEWEEVGEEMGRSTTVRSLLGMLVDEVDSLFDPATSDVEETDELLIAAGFALLRLTRQIDTEGLAWTREALGRWQATYGCVEADVMLTDLARLDDPTLPEHESTIEARRLEALAPRRFNWLSVDVIPPTSGAYRWSSWKRVKRDPLIRALESEADRLQAAIAPFPRGAGPWADWMDAHVGRSSSIEIWIMLKPGAADRHVVRPTRDGWSSTVTMDPDPHETISDAEARALVWGVCQRTLDRIAAKANLPAPPPVSDPGSRRSS